ncbi:hypothetical protein VIDI103191_20355 [Vibrio diazotrophicus]
MVETIKVGALCEFLLAAFIRLTIAQGAYLPTGFRKKHLSSGKVCQLWGWITSLHLTVKSVDIEESCAIIPNDGRAVITLLFLYLKFV